MGVNGPSNWLYGIFKRAVVHYQWCGLRIQDHSKYTGYILLVHKLWKLYTRHLKCQRIKLCGRDIFYLNKYMNTSVLEQMGLGVLQGEYLLCDNVPIHLSQVKVFYYNNAHFLAFL